MELAVTFLSFSLLGALLSLISFFFSLWCFVELRAQKKSTHTVIPIQTGDAMKQFEKHVKDLTGTDFSALNKDLVNAGMDPESLV